MIQAPGFRDNDVAGRFELTKSGLTASARYQRRADVLVISYVFAPPALRGAGTADRLMRKVAETARAEGRKIIATCGYANGWLRSHKAHRDLLAD